MRDRLWDLGRRLIVLASVTILVIGSALGTGTAELGNEPQTVDANMSTSPDGEDVEVSKDEIVYGTLSAAGAVDALYVVNHFVTMPNEPVEDHGDYESVQNLTNTDAISLSDGTVRFTPDTDSFYYQGNMRSRVLPWKFEVTYSLDGEEMAAEELAGKDGRLAIHIMTERSPDGEAMFYDNYMLQISVTLDRDLCKRISAPGATVASAGKNAVIAYTVLPGKDADVTLGADVHDFEMATGISVTGMPYSMEIELPDMEDSLKDLEQLPDAISSLNDGVGQLAAGTADMRSGVAQLAEGSSGIRSGLSLLEDSGSQIRSGSRQIENGLSEMAQGLASSGVADMDLSAVEQLPQSLGALKDGLVELSVGLSSLKEGYVQAYAALDGAIGAIPEPTLTEEAIQGAAMAAAQTDPEAAGVIAELAESYQAAQTVRGTYEMVREAFAAVEPAIDQATGGLDEMVSQLDASLTQMEGQISQLDGLSQLSELSEGLSTLASRYGEFSDGLSSYIEGVSTLSQNYRSFDNGISSLSQGVRDLDSGVSELHQGTGTLSSETEDLPRMIQDEIDKMKEEYLPADYEPVSFTSAENKDTQFVQFVLQMKGVSIPKEEPQGDESQDENETFWDRLASLF